MKEEDVVKSIASFENARNAAPPTMFLKDSQI